MFIYSRNLSERKFLHTREKARLYDILHNTKCVHKLDRNRYITAKRVVGYRMSC